MGWRREQSPCGGTKRSGPGAQGDLLLKPDGSPRQSRAAEGQDSTFTCPWLPLPESFPITQQGLERQAEATGLKASPQHGPTVHESHRPERLRQNPDLQNVLHPSHVF